MAAFFAAFAAPSIGGSGGGAKGVRAVAVLRPSIPSRSSRPARESPSPSPESVMKAASSRGASPKFIPVPPIAASSSADSMTAASLTSSGIAPEVKRWAISRARSSWPRSRSAEPMAR